LLCAGTQRVGFQAISSSREDQWCTSDPAQLAAQDDADDGTVEAIDLDSYQDLDLAAGTGDEFVELDAA
jgi:hypothetical protein